MSKKIDRRSDNYPLFEHAFNSIVNAPDHAASRFALAFTLPPNMACILEGLQRCADVVTNCSLKAELITALGYESESAFTDAIDSVRDCLFGIVNTVSEPPFIWRQSKQLKLDSNHPLLWPMASPDSDERHPFRNYAVEPALQFSLQFYDRDDDLESEYHSFQTEFIAASALHLLNKCDHQIYAKWCEQWAKTSAKKAHDYNPLTALTTTGISRFQNAARSVRRLSRPEHRDALELMSQTNPSTFRDWMRASIEVDESNDSKKCLNLLIPWHKTLHPTPGPVIVGPVKSPGYRSTTRRGKTLGDGLVRVAGDMGMFGLALDDDAFIEGIDETSHLPEDLTELLEEGIPPEEILNPAELTLIRLSDEYGDLSPPAAAQIAARSSDQLKRRNQEPLWGINHLTSQESSAISRLLQDNSDPKPLSKDGQARFMPYLLVVACVITGRNFQEVAHTHIVDEWPEHPEGLYFNRTKNSWLLPIDAPQYETDPCPNEQKNSRNLITHLEVADVSGFGDRLQKCGIGKGRLCNRLSGQVQSAIKELTRSISPDRPLTETRLMSLMADRIQISSRNDISVVHLLTSVRRAHSATNRYYSTL